MNDVFKRIVTLFVVSTVAVLIVAVYFFSNQFRNARKVESVDNLSGRRIAVVSSYEPDYILTGRDDITLLRYDSEADALMALCYEQADAYAGALDDVNYMLSHTTGLAVNDEPIASNSMASLFWVESGLVDDFNNFISEYKKTSEYQEYLAICNNNGYYDGSPITKETGTGRTITVGYVYDYIPIVFYDTINNCVNGNEADIFRRFANYMNYQIEWVEETETTGVSDLKAGKIDALLSGYSDAYRDEVDKETTIAMGDSYRDSAIVLLCVVDRDNLSISGMTKTEEE